MLTLTQPQHTRALPAHLPVTITIPPTATGPTGGDGSVPVAFTGDWLADGCPCHTYREGYAGILTDRWNGWAVFSVTRPVAEAIVRRHQADFAQRIRTAKDPADVWLSMLTGMASVSWLGDMIVVDKRVQFDDETAVEIVVPGADGSYTVGWGWTWDDVDAADIHTVHTGHSR